jgi:tRNA (guanine-N7-)-methyltransferase
MVCKPLPKLNSHTLPWHTDWNTIFDREAPLILEIGFGFGHFLDYLQAIYPDHNIIGVEVHNACLSKVESMIAKRGWTNVRVIYARAETALRHLFLPETISQIHINFPDPWFKERHSGRRLMQRDTLDAMVSRLIPDGKLFLATDIREYADMSHEILSDTPGLTNLLETPWVYEMKDRIVTKYEKKARQVGRPCHYFAYQRNDVPVPHLPVITEREMPHIVLENTQPPDEILEHFEIRNFAEGDLRVKLMSAYRGSRGLLFEVFVYEPTILQQIAFLYIRKEDTDNQYTIKLSGIGNPRPTDGVHYAVKVLSEWIMSLNPDATIIHNKVKS